jgi:hypothetical protein
MGMVYSASDLGRIQKATGINFGQAQLDSIFTLQGPEQTEQFIKDLQRVVFIYENSLLADGRVQESYAEEWRLVCKRIGIWFSYLSLLEPKRRGWFGKKEIPFPAKAMLSQVLSPDAPIRKTGILEI